MYKLNTAIICSFSIFLMFFSYSHAKEHYVNSMVGFQIALEESQSNNEDNLILLASKTYTGGFAYNSENNKSLTIKPADEYTTNQVVIDAGSSTCPLSISAKGGVKISSIIIINGKSSLGGLNIKTSGNVEIFNCQIKNNSSGGGLRIDVTGNVLVQKCNVQNNSTNLNGGGAYIKANDVTVTDSILSDNSGKYGGGIYIAAANDTMFHKNIVNTNSINGECGNNRHDVLTPIGGGGLYVKTKTLSLTNNNFINNKVNSYNCALGGGLYTYCSGTAILSENIITKNIVKASNNRFGSFGAGIYTTLNDGKFILKNNTISDNVGSYSSSIGMGIHFDAYYPEKDLIIVNNIIWGNKNGSSADDIGIYKAHQNVKVWHNIYDVIRVYYTDYSISPIGTIQSNPMFVNPQMDDYNINNTSPAINSGTTEAIDLSKTDIIGNNRVNGVSVDIGAYEYSNKIQPPVFNQQDLQYVPLYVTITCETPDAQIMYTTDNTIPDPTSILYTEPIYLTIATIVTAKAFKDGMDESDAVSMTYIKKEIISPTDTDHDGVIDQFDECPNTISYKAIYSNGCVAQDIYDQVSNLTNKNNELIFIFDIGRDNKKGLPEAIDALKTAAGMMQDDFRLYTAEGIYLFNTETKVLMLNIQNSTFPENSYYYNGILQYEVLSISENNISLSDNNSDQIIWERNAGEGIIGEWRYGYNGYSYYIVLAENSSLQIYIKNK